MNTHESIANVVKETLTIGKSYTVRDFKDCTNAFDHLPNAFTAELIYVRATKTVFLAGKKTYVMDTAALAEAIGMGEITIHDSHPPRPKEQFNVRLSGHILDLVDLIVETTGFTKTAVIQNAIALYAEKIRIEYVD
jgi:hypothetical protein